MSLSYDPLGRLAHTSGGATTRYAYDGAAMIAQREQAPVHRPDMVGADRLELPTLSV